MKIPSTGINESDLFQVMQSYSSDDLNWRNGRTFAYVYDAGKDVEQIGKKAYMRYLMENALDPSVYPSLLRFENEVVQMAISHLNGSGSAVGNYTSGGTESCLLAVKAARDYARKHKPHIETPEMILPETAHGAFHKAAQYFNINLKTIPVDRETYKAVPALIEESINENTILIVGSAISYPYGVVDPIPELGKIANKYDIWLHVDACMGGFLLPYFKRLGNKVTDFDLSVTGVTSISMDLHKFAYCPKGSSVILYKNKERRKYQFFICSDWSGYTIINPTIQSSKSGGPLAATWAVLQYIGDDGYLQFAKKIHRATNIIIDAIQSINELKIIGKPEMNLLSFTSDHVDIFKIIDLMRQKNWYIQPQYRFKPHKENIHLSINHKHLNNCEEFIDDLKESITLAKQYKKSGINKLEYKNLGKNKIDIDFYKDILLKQCPSADQHSEKNWADYHNTINEMPSEIKNLYLRELTNDIYKLTN